MKTMKNSNKLLWYLGYCILFVVCSCKKFVQVEAPSQLIETNAVFSSDKTAISSVTGLYIQMRNQSLSITNGGVSVFAGLSADEIINSVPSTLADPFAKNALLPSNSTITTGFWTAAYKSIYQTNAILEGVSRSKSLTDSVSGALSGEMKLVRSFYYFYLTQLFGDVPLILSTDYSVNAAAPRTTTNTIQDQVIADLKDAKNRLSPNYVSSGRGRPNKWTASALLARIFLLKKDWVQAEAEASEVINSGLYSLSTSLSNVFTGNSNETIWQLLRDQSNTVEGSVFIPSSGSARPSYILTSNLLNSFEAGDERKTSWIKTNTIGSTPYHYPYKYKMRLSTPVSEYEIVLRLAELYLIRAEARAEQNNLSGALDDLNIIRARAGLSDYTSTNRDSVLSAIRH
ncbi:MAG TPA: RagB/SusD family nutrient uptake outer membrane protein, partial [Chitinophagaceae bacterium]|nr:RagB/SusD family nutrient uptake outer membrane protein [Chitinophagaceae bacterium]